MKYKFASLAFLFLLAGCLDQSWVQYGYGGARDDCQDEAADIVSDMKNVPSRSKVLKEKFSDCMGKKGWKITTAKPPMRTATQQPPLDAAKRTETAPVSPAPRTQQPREVTAPVAQPVAPVATTTRSAPAPSTYQPEVPVSQPPGVAAPGRYFGPR
jgi:hypothetical protein